MNELSFPNLHPLGEDRGRGNMLGIAPYVVAQDYASTQSFFKKMDSYHPKEPHWYLPLLGVDPFYHSKGFGSALLQLGRLARLRMYGTCSSRGASAVSDLGAVPIDYQHQDFVTEIHRLTGAGVDVVFDPIGGNHIWRSRKALRPGGTVVAYGLTSSLRGGRLASGRPGRRHRFRGIAIFGLYIAGGWLLPGRKRVLTYSIQWLKRLRPACFRGDLIALFDLLQQKKIEPLIAQRLALAEARRAHELLGKGGVTGKIVLVRDGSSLGSGRA